MGLRGVRRIGCASGTGQILERLGRIEQSVAAIGAKLDQRGPVHEVLGVFSDGLAAYRRRILDTNGRARVHDLRCQLVARMIQDQALGYPHRKIVERLLEQYDPTTGRFHETPFNRLVRIARVGKSRAKNYLALLERRGYVERRSDGYRTGFSIRAVQA